MIKRHDYEIVLKKITSKLRPKKKINALIVVESSKYETVKNALLKIYPAKNTFLVCADLYVLNVEKFILRFQIV